MGTGSRRVSIRKESGRGLCDIAVEKAVGIELKRNLKSKSQVDRAKGQLQTFLREYSEGVIVVLVGKTGGNAYEELLDGIRGLPLGNGLTQPRKRVKVVDKGRSSRKPQRPSRSRRPFDFGF